MPVPESGAEHIKVNSYVLFFRLRYNFLIYDRQLPYIFILK